MSAAEDQNIRGSVGDRLGNNQLRVYLSNKSETSKSIINKPVEKYIPYDILKNKKIKVSLVSPSITIPKGMSKRCIPPLGLLYIASYLLRKNIDVSLYDCVVEGYNNEEHGENNLMTYGVSPEDAAKTILEKKPNVVGMSVLFSTDLHNLVKLCAEIKKTDRNVLIIVGGLHPTIYPSDIWNICENEKGEKIIDFIIRGEGEKRLYDFILDLTAGKVNIKMDGLCGSVKGGVYFSNHQIETIQDLDSLPFPAYNLLPMEKYFSINVPFSPVPQGKRVMQIMTSRGCPVGCSFCASSNMYKKYRVRSVENVINEIKQLKDTYHIDEIQFADDNIFFNKKRSINLFKKLSFIDVIWCTPNGVMVNTLSEELLNIFKYSGLYQITLSIDSGSSNTLKNLQHKPVKLNTIPGLVKRCNELGIFSHGTLVVGLPGETIDDINEGFDFVNDLELTSISVFIASAIPGSELYHQALESGVITKERANKINTTKSDIHLSDISSEKLETIVMNFQYQFSENVKIKNPEMWEKKYGNLIEKSKKFDDNFGGRLT